MQLDHQWRSLAWGPWLESLSGSHTLLRYDSRGCGLSDRGTAGLSFENWVRDLEAVVEAAGFERFDLLGTCWGGPIAIEYAARHPERVGRLVLYGTYARGRFHWGDRPAEVEKARVMLDLTRLGWGQENHPFAKVWASSFQPGGSVEHMRSWCAQQCIATSAETAVQLLQIGYDTNVVDAARKVRCPVLVLHPERDAVVPIEQGRELAGLIADSRFVPVDSENHMPLADEPAWCQIIDEIEKFLSQPRSRVDVRERLPLGDLTPRERAVLEGIAGGLDNGEIAASLGLSEKTVRNHITRVFDKIGVEHRYQAIVRARDAGLGLANKLAAAR
jgi:pimeloyl-ACP methyl ester carboxylesterase/DNA-binding CsgD family transcriptional regulator